jgi:hypothetical protein
MMLPGIANGTAGQFWNEGDLMWQRVIFPSRIRTQ